MGSSVRADWINLTGAEIYLNQPVFHGGQRGEVENETFCADSAIVTFVGLTGSTRPLTCRTTISSTIISRSVT